MSKILKKLIEDNDKYDSNALVYIDDKTFAYNDGVSKEVLADIKNKEMQVYSAWYEFKSGWDTPKIHLNCRGNLSDKFELIIQNFVPYCYVDYPKGEFKTYLGKPVEKVLFYKKHPTEVKNFRDVVNSKEKKALRTYESDVVYCRRFMIDLYDYFKPKEAIKPSVAIFDIETNFPISDDIISFAINNQKDLIYFESKYDNLSPHTMAINLVGMLKDYDIITGWNSVKFDVPVVEKHIEKVIEFKKQLLSYNSDVKTVENTIKIRGSFGKYNEQILYALLDNDFIVIKDNKFVEGVPLYDKLNKYCASVDLKEMSKKMYAKQIEGNWSLDNVGIKIAKCQKYEYGEKYVRDLPEEILKEYNCIDVVVPEIIDNVLGGLETHNITCWSMHALYEDTAITAVVNDIALLRAYHHNNQVLNTRKYNKKEEEEVHYKAADPVARPGLYKWILATDLKHAYPSAVISLNISPETKDPNGKYIAPNGVRFNDKHSVFIDTLKALMEDRAKVKKKLLKTKKYSNEWKKLKSIDFALKTQAAAFSHGIFGWASSRMKDYEVADSITGVVRELIDDIKAKADEIGKPWTYCHTDSAFLTCSVEDTKKTLNVLNELIDNKFKGSPLIPTLEFDGNFKYAYIHSAARKILVEKDEYLDDVDKWVVTGMNFMRAEVPKELKAIEIECIKKYLKGHKQEDIKETLTEMVINLTDADSRDLGVIKPLKKRIHEYGRKLADGTIGGYPGHIKALMRAQDDGYLKDLTLDEKFMILPILTDETVGVRVIKRKEVVMAFSLDNGLPEKYEVDLEYYLKSNLWGKINNLFGLTPRELEKEIMNENVLKCIGAR